MIATTHPVNQLVQEHRVIETVLTAMEQQVAQFGTPTLPRPLLRARAGLFRQLRRRLPPL